MIQGFSEQTEPLTPYEQEILVPVLCRGLQSKVGKERAVTNKHIVACLKGKYQIGEARVRKIINHIRINGLVPCLMATSGGYYVATEEAELKEYEDSLLGREQAIRAVRMAITRQREEIYHGKELHIPFRH